MLLTNQEGRRINLRELFPKEKSNSSSFMFPAISVELHERGSAWLGYFFLPLPVIHRNHALLVVKPKYTRYPMTVKPLPRILFHSCYSRVCNWFWITAYLCRILTTIFSVIAPPTFHNIKNCWRSAIL